MSLITSIVPTAPNFVWEFCGPLAGLRPELAWKILFSAAAIGAVWILVSYSFTVVRLSIFARIGLIGLRLALMLLLLAALTNPTSIERTYAKQSPRPFALLVDCSDSMTAEGKRGASRFDDAWKRWRVISDSAARSHGRIQTYIFAADTAISNGEQIDKTKLKTGETHLIQALAKVLAEAPSGGWGGIIILTDGNETSPHTQGMTALVHNAQAAGTPLYFIPGYADTVEKVMETRPFATWNNLVVPAQIKPQSTFTVELTVDSFQSVPKSLPVKVRMGDEWRPGPPIFLNAGRRVSQWQMELKAEMPGVFPLEIVAGEPPDELRAITQIQVKSLRATTRLLYFDSSIDWGGE